MARIHGRGDHADYHLLDSFRERRRKNRCCFDWPADDNPVQLSARQMVLSQAGLEVQVATSADSALALLRSLSDAQNIGVIVTDHVMPKATGSEFVRLVREVNPDVPVIVISGLAEAEQEYDGMDVLFRQKPCPPAELIKLVQSAVDSSEHR